MDINLTKNEPMRPFPSCDRLQTSRLGVNNTENSPTSILTNENQVTINTDPITVPLIAKLDEEAKEFIENHQLGDGVNWLWKVATDYFPGAYFDLELLSGEDEYDTVLALRVYGSLSVSEFRNQNHALCEAMRKKGYNRLYEVISIFQRRTHRYERRAISWDSTLFANAA